MLIKECGKNIGIFKKNSTPNYCGLNITTNTTTISIRVGISLYILKNLEELKKKSPAELILKAEKLAIENPSTLRKQDILFAILKKLAQKNEQITGSGVLEVLQDGFGFLRAIESNYLPGPDDIYVSPNQIRKFGLRTGDSVEGEIRAPKDQERYYINYTFLINKNSTYELRRT